MSRFVLTAQLQLQAPNNVAQVVSQIQNQLNGLSVNVQVQGSAQAQRQIQQITQATNQATTAANRMGRAFAVSIRRFAAFSIATRAVGLFTSTLSSAVETAIDFERQMIKVSQVTGDSLAKLRGLTKTITNLSTGLGVSSQSLLEVSTVLLQAGLSAKDTEVALKSLAKAALAPNFDSIGETAEGAIAILAQFQKGVGALESQLGSINAVAGAFAVEASDLIDVIRRTGGVFKSSGGNLNELLALFTSVRATTRESAESIGTGLRTIFTRIQRPKTIEYLKQFGVELVDLEGKFVGPYEAVKRLSAALSGLGEGDITFIRIAEELGGFRQIGKVLPLLQQFSTAQAALNVATKSGNSLAQDAATAQAALAIKILKVKEEFLALVRSITETSTFQVMANTALQLASALIKIADAIKPLLPLLGALAAVKIARGIGGFLGGIGAGLTSQRTFHSGGRVHRFARGGLVPGSGNNDTVPAMLMPGEFVIRKSSVNKMGVGTLSAMNDNKFAAGGRVQTNRGFYGNTGPDGRSLVGKTRGLTLQEAIQAGFKRSQLSSAYGADAVNKALGTAATNRSEKEKAKTKNRKAAKGINDKDLKQLYPGGVFRTIPGTIGGFFLTPEVGTDSPYTLSAPYPFDLNGKKAAIAPGSTISNFVPFRNDLKKNLRLNNIIDNSAKRGLIDSIQSTAPKVNSFLDIAPTIDFNDQNIRGAAAKLAKDSQVVSTIGGYLFEGIIQGVTGAQLAGGRTSFDFPNVASVKDKLANMFTTSPASLGPLIKADAKRSKNPKTNMSIIDKLRQDIQKGDLSGVTKLASGGPIGTDTVPALLTPGEFVVNRASAQRIGYGNLHRMNKVGKYARGGVVQTFSTGGATLPMGAPGSIPGMETATTSMRRFVDCVDNASRAQTEQRRSVKEVVQSNKFFALSMTTGLMQGFLPALDDNSSSLTKLSHSMLGLITTITSVGFALEAFNIQLNGSQILGFLSGKGLGRVSAMARQGTSNLGRSIGGNLGQNISSFAPAMGRATQGLLKFAGPVLAATTSIYAFNAALTAFFDKTAEINKAVEKGDVEAAGRAARGQSNLDNANKSRMGLGVAGAIGGGLGAAQLGAILGTAIGPGVGTAIGAAIGVALGTLGSAITEKIGILFGGNTLASTVALAEAQAQSVKTNKAFEQSEKDAAKALKDLENGTIGAEEALRKIAPVALEAANSQSRNNKAILENNTNKSGTMSGIGRYISATATFGYVDTGAERNKKIDEQNAGINRQTLDTQRKVFDIERGIRNERIRGGIISGESENAVIGRDVTALQQKQAQFTAMSESAKKSGDLETASIFEEQAKLAGEQAKELKDSFANLSKEIEVAKKKFEAINLGFRSVTANSEAAALRLSNFVSNLEVGAVPAQQAVATLEASITKAGQAISANEVNSALDEVSGVFQQFGASESEIKKFRENLSGVAAVQRSFPTIFENMKSQIKSGGFKEMFSDNIGKMFKNEVDAQLKASGIGDSVRQRILDSMGDVKIGPEIIAAIDRGDYSALDEYLKDAGEEAQKVMKEVVDNYAKINQQLIDLTKQRIEAERNYIEAQKEALSIQIEARELQGKYGGTAVTNAERQANVLARANVGAGRMGLSELKAGSTDELRRRNDEIRQRFAGLEGGRRVAGGMAGREGVNKEAVQADLEKASKDQISTIRELIKIQEDELKIIQEKNKLEKDSLDALISGDIDKFFEQQAAVGATAAIATGNETLMQSFGAKALGNAYTDIQRQKDAGVQELYGIRLAGAGGLTERAAGASLAARGITDPRAAQMAARTTAEEERINANIRGLSNELADAGQVQADLAAMRLDTANINVQQAEITLAGGETLKVGGPSAPPMSGGAGASGTANTVSNAAAASAAGLSTASVAAGGGAGGAGGGGGTGGGVATGVGLAAAGGVGLQNVAAAGQATNRDIFGSIRYGAGAGAAAYNYAPRAINIARGIGGQFRAGMDIAQIGLGSGGLSRIGKLGYGAQTAASGIREGITRFGVGRGLEQAGYAATAGESIPARLGRFSVKAQNFAQNLPANLAQQYNYFQSGRALQQQGLTASTRAGRAGAFVQRGIQGFQNFRTGLSRTTAPTFGSRAMALGQRIGSIRNAVSPYVAGAANLGQRAFGMAGGNRLITGAAGLTSDFNFGRGLVGSGMENDAFTLAQKAGVGAQKLGNRAVTGMRAVGIQAQRLGLRASPMLGQIGNFAATQGRAAMIQAQRLGLRTLPVAQNALSAAGTAGSNLIKGFNVGRSGLANVGGMFGQQAAKTAGSTLAGRAGLLGGQTLARFAGSGVGKFAGSLLTKGAGLGLGTAISGVTNAAEFLYDPSAYNAKTQGKSDAGLSRAQTRNTAGFAYDSLAGAAEGFVDPVGKIVEAGYVMKDFAKDAMAASEASAKTERMKTASIDSTGLDVQERAWAKEQAMRENQLASAQAKGDTAGATQAQKELKDLEALRTRERTAGNYLPNFVTGAGGDSEEYKKYVEQQRTAQKAQEEAAKQQEAQAKAAQEVATPMSTLPSVPLVSPQEANVLLNQSGIQAMQASQTQQGRTSTQTLAGGTMVNQTAGTTTPISGMGIDPEVINTLMATLDKFNVDLSANIDRLANTNISIKLDTTNVNVNLTGGDFLAKLTQDVQKAVMQEISNKLQNASIGNDGKLKLSSGSLAGSPAAPA